MKKVYLLLVIFIGVFLTTNTASAHQPRLVWEMQSTYASPFIIDNQDISQAFYGILKDKPEYYKVKIDQRSDLYLSLLVPDNINAAVSVSARVFKLNSSDEEIKIFLNGDRSLWKSYFEEFAGDFYLQGPDGARILKPGEYLIEITSNANEGKYVLVVGQKESFPLNEAMKMILNLPKLKLDFFEEPIYMLAGGIVGKLFSALLLFILLLILMSLRKVREKKERR